ncbi:DUF4407 domain-containing protein [Actinoplanes sp. NPDC051470]|uniref:DUF4407 domain-containing protein n=1 Tax=unclassified Actinoplanes TaxID=2626549 RepID=UPI00341249D4
MKMTTDTVELPRIRLSPEDLGRATTQPTVADRRPVEPDPSVAVLPRRLIGIREDILDWVPEERPRYTRLGLILVNTGLMAAISLFVAVQRVLDVPWPVIVPMALFWGVLVLAIDSWMVSSTHGSTGHKRWLMFVPRLIMAVLLGSVIAEPLVLWIFHPAIHANVEHDRQEQIRTEAGLWARCNPATGGSTAAVPECHDYQLGVDGTAAAQGSLVNLSAERDKLSGDVTRLNDELDVKQKFAQDECAGVKRDGTSGRAGKGFRCDRATQVADRFQREIDLPAKRARITELDTQINAQTGTLAGQQKSHSDVVAQGIKTKVDAFAGSFGKIDIIDEARGLERLSDESPFVTAAQWLVRMLLIMVDSLPVLAKILGGTTSYDRLVNAKLQAGLRFFGHRLSVVDHTVEASVQQTIHQIDERTRAVQEQHDQDLDEEIDRRTARYAVPGD